MKHNLTRRKFIQASTAVATAVYISPSIALAKDSQAQHNIDQYVPQYFSQEEWDFILAVTDQLIPEDELGGGAIAAGVPQFIDQQMLTEFGTGELFYMNAPYDLNAKLTLGYQEQYPPNKLYKKAIAEINKFSQEKYQKTFAKLDENTQISIIEDLEAGKIALAGITSSTAFFNLLWKNAQEGFFADPKYGGNKNMMGWKMVGFPGARADYMDFVDKPGEVYPYGPVNLAGKRG